MPRRTTPLPRYLAPRLREALADTPAVLIHGPRGYHYVSFDDEAVQGAARRDPIGFVEGLPPRTILDEVQRVPEIFTSLKAAIDRRRTAGRFILTGSANVLLVPKLADSLAGRMGIGPPMCRITYGLFQPRLNARAAKRTRRVNPANRMLASDRLLQRFAKRNAASRQTFDFLTNPTISTSSPIE